VFRDYSIKTKLRAVILGASVLVLLAASTAFVTLEVFSFRNELRRNLEILAQIIASNSTSSLAFQDQKDAAEILSALQAEPHIVTAALYDANGALFAAYQRHGSAEPPAIPGPDGYTFGRNKLTLIEPVEVDTRLGTLYIESNLGALHAQLRHYAGIVALVIAGAIAFAVFLSTVLQHRISNPIIALAENARVVTRSKDYSVRANKQGEDEIGLLTDAFNDMLGEIQQSQSQLRTALRTTQAAHEEIRLLNQDLETRVRERTVALQEAVAQMEAFSYSVSHDLRAPLRAIYGYAQALLADCGNDLSPQAQAYARRMKQSAERLDRLIQDILTYSRVAREELRTEPVDLDRLVHDIVQQYPTFQPPNAAIQIVSPLLAVKAHEASLTQCIANLLSNAVKFVAPGVSPVVKIWTENRNGSVRLWVEDNGIGIPPEYHERIFGIFERVHPDKTYEGTGIGLSIVRKGVERMGGKVGFEPNLAGGTRFWIELPAC
jgi:signal transduction histidine kinase